MRANHCARMGREVVSGGEPVLNREMVPGREAMLDHEPVIDREAVINRESVIDSRKMAGGGGGCGEELSILQWRRESIERRAELPP